MEEINVKIYKVESNVVKEHEILLSKIPDIHEFLEIEKGNQHIEYLCNVVEIDDFYLNTYVPDTLKYKVYDIRGEWLKKNKEEEAFLLKQMELWKR
jgi:hypothetical protein